MKMLFWPVPHKIEMEDNGKPEVLYRTRGHDVQASPFIDRAAVESQVEPLSRVAQSHASGKEAYARSIAIELFEDFLHIEERFAANKTATEQEVIDSMRLVSTVQSTICKQNRAEL